MALYCTKLQRRYELLKSKLLFTKPSHLGLVHLVWDQNKIREFSMGLSGTLNGPIFTFTRSSLELAELATV